MLLENYLLMVAFLENEVTQQKARILIIKYAIHPSCSATYFLYNCFRLFSFYLFFQL